MTTAPADLDIEDEVGIVSTVRPGGNADDGGDRGGWLFSGTTRVGSNVSTESTLSLMFCEFISELPTLSPLSKKPNIFLRTKNYREIGEPKPEPIGGNSSNYLLLQNNYWSNYLYPLLKNNYFLFP